MLAAHEESPAPYRCATRKRKNPSPWEGWKWWGWKKIEAAIDRTVASVKNGPALRVAVDKHHDRVNAIFARIDAAYDRRKGEITAAEPDPERRRQRLNRLLSKHYQIRFRILRKSGRILVQMLMRATAAGEWW